ncbi:MAG: hypothetical protein LBR19_00385 [Bifidobacteriaceae bacterium]|jgi:hypothetical protein|nr:hypothetical protein [Bifidobacteriaceae bacterium]
MNRPATTCRPAWRAAAGLVTAGLAVFAVAGCSVRLPGPVEGQREWDPALLADVMAQAAAQASACVEAGGGDRFTAEGLAYLADHLPQWAQALGAAEATDGSATASPRQVVDCSPGALIDGLDRLRGLLEMGEDMGAFDGFNLSLVKRALALDWQLAATGPVTQDLDQAPGIDDLSNLDVAALTDLALAEDQAGFVDEYLAAQAVNPELRASVVELAAWHRERAAGLALMAVRAGGVDPRQGAYTLPDAPADDAAVSEAIGQTEITVAIHYAALPYPSPAEATITWELLYAHTWGLELPAFPLAE